MAPRALDKRSFLRMAIAVVLFFGGRLATAKLPEGWIRAGDHPKDYDMDVDPGASYGGKPSARVQSKVEKIDGFGTLMQTVKADDYRGKRLRLSGYVKAEKIEAWAGLWMRVDSEDHGHTAFDNMQDRPITGTLDWKSYQVVLDVAADSKAVAFGILLAGTGTVWLNQARIEVVDKSVPTTGGAQSRKPENLDFSR